MTKEKIIKKLKKQQQKLLALPHDKGAFINNIEADKLLYDIKNTPQAFVLGCVVDRQVPAERAWIIPYKIKQEVGTLEIKVLAKKTRKYWYNLFHKKRLHRFNTIIADCFYEAVKLINKKYNGDASKIWTTTDCGGEIYNRFLEFKGVGEKIAAMATNILMRRFKVSIRDLSLIDVAPDVHIKRVFYRLGLISKQDNKSAIEVARELNPKYPGVFDLPLWELGKEYCSAQSPNCKDCYLNKLCPKTGVKK